MKCTVTNCRGEAVILKRYEGTALCEKHFYESVERRVRKTIRMNKLIDYGDKIAVALSGGKDSSLCLYLLKKIVAEDKKVKIFAIIIDEGVKGYRAEGIKQAKKFCKLLKVKYYVYSFKKEFGFGIDDVVKKRKSDVLACTYCGVLRRRILNKYAKKLGATKLATGHNLDDEVQSIMANYIRGDILRTARLGAKAYIIKDKRFVPRIKPLRDILEKEDALFVVLKKFPVDFTKCPYAHESFRWDVRNIVNDLEAKYAGSKFSILRSFDKLLPELKKTYKNAEINACTKCGEPTSGEVCKFCLLTKTI